MAMSLHSIGNRGWEPASSGSDVMAALRKLMASPRKLSALLQRLGKQDQ
jgi:hypothetical protein